jgi:hypothetical protein
MVMSVALFSCVSVLVESTALKTPLAGQRKLPDILGTETFVWHDALSNLASGEFDDALRVAFVLAWQAAGEEGVTEPE